MKTKLILASALILSSLFGFCQNVPFSSNTSFSSEVKFEPIVFKKTPTQLPVTILSLSKIGFNINFSELNSYPALYDLVRVGQLTNDVRMLNPYYRRQDANGVDLPQDVITKEMINNLLRRN